MSRDKVDQGGVLRPSDGVTSPVSVSASAAESDHFEISFLMSSDAFEMLDRLARTSGQELDKVIGKAFLLYQAAVEARGEGKAVGIASTADVLEVEFTGL